MPLHPRRSPAPHLQYPPSLRGTPKRATSSFEARDLKLFPKQETFFKILNLLPTTKGATSWCKVWEFQFSCCQTPRGWWLPSGSTVRVGTACCCHHQLRNSLEGNMFAIG